jgi:hypothetical protein
MRYVWGRIKLLVTLAGLVWRKSVNIYMDTLLLLGPQDMSRRTRNVLKMLAVDPEATEAPLTPAERDEQLIAKWGTSD